MNISPKKLSLISLLTGLTILAAGCSATPATTPTPSPQESQSMGPGNADASSQYVESTLKEPFDYKNENEKSNNYPKQNTGIKTPDQVQK
jgi:PBP1b-binding outer membrane lipoprotein LpoB